MTEHEDTVAAICTGAGGAIAIVRVSGQDCLAVASRCWAAPSGKPLSAASARRMILGRFQGEPVLAVYMPGPRSYTGEDVVELHCHGGAAAPRRLLEELLRQGARPARPGEFTRRAFLNGRMDLTQAEAVADLIEAKSSSALALAERQMSGALGSSVRKTRERLSDVLAELESRLDFPEEELAWKEPSVLVSELDVCSQELEKLLASRRDGVVLREGVRLVIAGRPNVGKSSLLNALLGYERAIVSPIPGTTRDTVEESASLRGIPVRLADTAGLRETSDKIEMLGVERSLKSLAGAEVALWLLDASSSAPDEELAALKENLPRLKSVVAVWNKADLRDESAPPLPDAGVPSVEVSALSGKGLPALLDLFEKAVWGREARSEPEAAVSLRHSKLLEDALPELSDAKAQVAAERWELAASSLRCALRSLGEITGEEASPDVLDMIFSRFCIGK